MTLRRFGGPGMHGIGGVPLSSLGGGALGTYAGKVLGYGPIAYWPLNEASGTVAHCLVNSAQNGTYNSDVSGWPPGTGIGDGNTAPFFDGANDYANVFSAALAAAFNGATGSIMSWSKVANVGVWTDGVNRYIYNIQRNAGNVVYALRDGVTGANKTQLGYAANGIWEVSQPTPGPTLNWMNYVVTWNKPAEQVMYYYNGAWYETDVTLGVFVVPLTLALIGAISVVPANVWHGWLAHFALWDRVLSPTEIAALNIV